MGLALHQDLDHQPGRALAFTGLGTAQARLGDHPAATASHQQALQIFRDIRHRLGQASGDHLTAAASLTQALDIYRELGDQGSAAEVLNDLGEVLARSGENHQARDHHTQALAIAREISTPLEEARALEGIGHRLRRDGNPDDTTAHWSQALMIYQQIGAPDAQRVRELLHQQGIATTSLPAATAT